MSEQNIGVIHPGIIGFPVWERGKTWLYLSGERASNPDVACLAWLTSSTGIVRVLLLLMSASSMAIPARPDAGWRDAETISRPPPGSRRHRGGAGSLSIWSEFRVWLPGLRLTSPGAGRSPTGLITGQGDVPCG